MKRRRQTTTEAGWRPLDDPDELNRLDTEAIKRRVAPLLRRGGLVNGGDAARNLENAAQAAQQLSDAWRADSRGEPFGEYLAKRLARRVRELGRSQPFDPTDRFPEPILSPEPDSEPESEPDSEPERWTLAHGIDAAYVDVFGAPLASATQAAIIAAVEKVAAGNINTAYRMKRELGGTRREAQTNAATAALRAARDVAREYAGEPDAGPSDLGPEIRVTERFTFGRHEGD